MDETESLLRARWYRVTVTSPVLVVLENCPAEVFKEGDNKVGRKMPGILFLNSGRPSAMVDVTGTKGFFSISP